MDGRWKRWACAGLAAGAVGCNRNATLPDSGLPVSQGRQPFQAADAAPRVAPGVTQAVQVTTRDRPRKGQPIKPETEVAWADTQVEAAFMEGRPAVERDNLIDAARQGYQRALKADPKNRGALVGLARLYAKAGDKEKSVATFQTALRYAPKDHEIAHRMAATQVQFGDFAGAAESCRAALAADPENRTYHKTLGYCQAHLGKWDDAFGTLLAVMPEPQARYFLGRAMIDLDRVDDGKQQIQTAANLDPQFTLPKQYLADLSAGKPVPAEPVLQAGYDGK